MTAVHEPSLQLLQLTTHLAPLLGPTLGLCSLLFNKATMLDFSLCESPKAVRGLGGRWRPLHGVYSAPQGVWQAAGTRPPDGTNLAPNTLPVWAVEPWIGIGFHCAHISSVYGVLLYPILDGFARHAWLGPRTTARAKPSNPKRAQATPKAGRRSALYGPGPVALGSRSRFHVAK
jgi:hypothetical protein